MPKIKSSYFFYFLATITIIEKIFLVINPDLIFFLNNYDDGSTFSRNQAASILGGVHSFGGNRSVSGVILLSGFFYFFYEKKKFSFPSLFLLFSSLICMSGSVYWLFLVWLIYISVSSFKFNSFLQLIFYTVSIILLCIIIIYFINFFGKFNDRFSLQYFNFILDYKINQISSQLIQFNFFNFLIGTGDNLYGFASDPMAGIGGIAGDFMALDFFVRFGLLGFVVYGIIFLKLKKDNTRVSIFVLVIGLIHYHTAVSTTGQILFALLILENMFKNKELIKTKYNNNLV